MTSEAYWHATRGVAEVLLPRGKSLQSMGRYLKRSQNPWLLRHSSTANTEKTTDSSLSHLHNSVPDNTSAHVLTAEETVFLVRNGKLKLFTHNFFRNSDTTTTSTPPPVRKKRRLETSASRPKVTSTVSVSNSTSTAEAGNTHVMLTEATLLQSLYTSALPFSWSKFLAYARLRALDFLVLHHQRPQHMAQSPCEHQSKNTDCVTVADFCRLQQCQQPVSECLCHHNLLAFDVFRPNSRFRRSNPGILLHQSSRIEVHYEAPLKVLLQIL